MNKKSICAVVVTYNRKELLLECLSALKQQTYPVDHIVVINNASTDGTVDFLREHNWNDDESFQLVTLNENMGGAGGFHQGIKYAYEKGFDYIWLMDDDGYPEQHCLAELMQVASKTSYIGPIVLDKTNNDKLSFSLRIPGTLTVFDSFTKLKQDLNGKTAINNAILPFNGTLISKYLIPQIGYPEYQYFIWGDEKEYTLRAEQAGANIATITTAKFFHPAESSSSVPMFFGKLRFNNASSMLKLYCFCRNSIATYMKHYGISYSLAFTLKTLWFFSITKPNIKKLTIALKAIYHGIRKDFTHHKDYL